MQVVLPLLLLLPPLLLLLLLLQLQVACPIHAFSVSSSRGTETEPVLPLFCSFAFAPNGVCIQPAYFVAVEEARPNCIPTHATQL